ncbi:hypothetical protein [Winogradskyella luteola]|uniref:Uncharacterized protein n=1 Tax=Winogradskyella luteola TaxID=2828330 RepID=A0A9X1F6Z2_9FLAO|nr:hypothetical protein [Winogradskyella luteola]MBV7268379.1 hypothetical protein [Winogradskyella luteola]
MDQGKTAKDSAKLVKVTEKTFGNWIEKYGWKKLRDAKENSRDQRIDNIKNVIDGITEDRQATRTRLNELKADLKTYLNTKDDDAVEITREMITEARKEIVGYDDAISKWNKTLENFDKERTVSLSNYLYVMDEVFKDMQMVDTDLYLKTLDFQEQHITKASLKLG